MEGKFNIEGGLFGVWVSYDELSNIINALDLYSRIYIGQYDHILNHLRWNTKAYRLTNVEEEEIEKELYDLRSSFIPELDNDSRASLGIWSPYTPDNAVKAYDIQQVLRYQLTRYNDPEGQGNTVNYYNPMIRGEWENTDKLRTHFTDIVKSYNYKDIHPRGVYSVWYCPVAIKEFKDDKCLIEMTNEGSIIISTALDCVNQIENLDLLNTFKLLYPEMELEKDEPIIAYCIGLEHYIGALNFNHMCKEVFKC